MQQLLKQIISVKPLYARLLNTLSLLEYIGARKIIKSQEHQSLNLKLLAHVSEEIRHAYVLKRAALKISADCESYAPEALLCGAEAYQYFQTVDQSPIQELGETHAFHCYLYVTWLIETRALSFYTTMEQVLQQLGEPSVFRGILAEEQQHFRDMEQWLQVIPDYQSNLKRLQNREAQAFGVFLQALNEAVASPPLGARAACPQKELAEALFAGGPLALPGNLDIYE